MELWERRIALKLVLYVALGFCLALAVVFAWRKAFSPVPLTPSSPTSSPTISPPAIPNPPPALLTKPRPSAVGPSLDVRSQDTRQEARGPIEQGPQVVEPSQSEHPERPRTAIKEPYEPTEDEKAAMRSSLQDSLQRKIDEDEELRGILLEAVKTHLGRRGRGGE